PLDRARLRTIAVVGPNAKGVHLGGYSRDPGRGVDVVSGIAEKVGPAVRVIHAEGVRITEGEPNWSQDAVVFGDPAKNRQRIQEAVDLVGPADAIVVVVGTNESTSREAYSDQHLGDAVDLSREPLWPFGYGLSYTTFSLANVRVTPATIAADGTAQVSADVTNTGARAGDEVVQLYIRDVVSSVTRPIKELRGFERVSLA